MSVNIATLSGFLGNKPEIKCFSNGREYLVLSLATNSYYYKKTETGEKGEKVEETTWHRILCYNKHMVKYCKEYAEKGHYITVIGTIKNDKYINKNNETRYISYIAANQIELPKKQNINIKESENLNNPNPDSSIDVQRENEYEDNI